MTPRERVLAALEHQETDRVPVDLSGHRSSGIAAIAYPKLREHLSLPPRPIRVYDIIQQLAVVDDDVLDRFGVDTMACFVPAWTNIERDGNRWIIRSDSGRILAHMPDGSLYFEQTYYPFLEGDDLNAISDVLGESMWTAIASPPGPVDSKELSEGAKNLREGTDRAIIGLFGGNLFEVGHFLYRNDNFMMLLAAEPQHAHRFLDKLIELHLANLERFLAAVAEYIDIILFGDDLGMQT
ncbi:MAG: uroporphyrinogen decarboxylase family protein, partial [Planctomycetota bacterium]